MTISAPVSVIIITYNRCAELRDCLRSLEILRTPVRETIVVDNHSEDGTLDMIRSEFPATVVLVNPENYGTAYSRNQAINVARGQYVWFLDSDTLIPHPDVLENMLRFCREHPDTGSIGGQMIREDGELRYWVMAKDGDRKMPVVPGPPHQFETHYLATCNCLVPRSRLLEIGGFDHFYFYYCEDVDLGMRLGRLGLKNVFRSDCAVLHCFAQKERRGTYYLHYRNEIRCRIRNWSVWQLVIFPILHFGRTAAEYLALRKNPHWLGKVRTLSIADKQRHRPSWMAVRIASAMILGMAGAFLWNLVHLPQTLYYRWHQPDCLQTVRL